MGQHDFSLRLPVEVSACSPCARNASVVVRGLGAYSHVTVDFKGGATSPDTTAAAPDRHLASSDFHDTNPNPNSFAMHGEF